MNDKKQVFLLFLKDINLFEGDYVGGEIEALLIKDNRKFWEFRFTFPKVLSPSAYINLVQG